MQSSSWTKFAQVKSRNNKLKSYIRVRALAWSISSLNSWRTLVNRSVTSSSLDWTLQPNRSKWWDSHRSLCHRCHLNPWCSSQQWACSTRLWVNSHHPWECNSQSWVTHRWCNRLAKERSINTVRAFNNTNNNRWVRLLWDNPGNIHQCNNNRFSQLATLNRCHKEFHRECLHSSNQAKCSTGTILRCNSKCTDSNPHPRWHKLNMLRCSKSRMASSASRTNSKCEIYHMIKLRNKHV